MLRLRLTQDRWVRAFEFRPGNRKVVHHSLVFADASGAARRRDAADPRPGYRCFGVPGFLPAAGFGGWAPGASPVPYPAGVALTLPRQSDLVVQIHYHPAGKPETDRSTVALYFAAKPPEKKMMDIPLGSHQIDIPPGISDYRVTDYFTLPVDVWAVAIIPHAHYLCRQMRGVALLPDGRQLPLITIRDWDFNWQQQYRYGKPVLLPEGTRLKMEFIYDDSEGNPQNPSSPPRRVVWGPDSTDEMAGLHVQVIPVRPQDAHELGLTIWGKIVRMAGGSFYTFPTRR